MTNNQVLEHFLTICYELDTRGEYIQGDKTYLTKEAWTQLQKVFKEDAYKHACNVIENQLSKDCKVARGVYQ